ncbi:MAG: hypothetical protein M3389_06305, partial [Actinomycetota bacterium]|nr:hypothetical protein [Actinomycetota bacterium]
MPEEPTRALAISIVLVALFTFFFVYPGHDPKPNGLRVAVVAAGGGAPDAAAAADGAAFPEGVEAV